MGDCQALAAFLLTPKATFRGKNEGNPKPEPKKDATEMLYRWLQVKLFHFSATSQASLSNLDEEEYFNNIEKSLSPVSFTIYFNVV
ncbi:hypothetical protein Avbf_01727 [Armadillidium vulgare]|nr:hypothetical protein Avbf_01727 [Armadillidium vulgare]